MFVAILLLKNNLYREVKKIRQISILNFKGYNFEKLGYNFNIDCGCILKLGDRLYKCEFKKDEI
jgi:hypothetical protein